MNSTLVGYCLVLLYSPLLSSFAFYRFRLKRISSWPPPADDGDAGGDVLQRRVTRTGKLNERSVD